jgi:hypothetical protein
MRNLLLGFCLMLGCASVAHGQDAITLKFGSSKPRTIWVGPPDSRTLANTQIDTDAASYGFKSRPGGANDALFVWDKSTGNVASISLQKVGTEWLPKPADFRRIGRVVVRVEYKGDPLQAANISLRDAVGAQTKLIDAESAGEAHFHLLAPGKLSVEVTYKPKVGDADPVKQIFEVPLARSEPEPILVVSVPKEAATVSEGQAEGTAGSAPTTGNASEGQGRGGPAAGGGPSPIGQIIAFLLSLAVAAALLYFALQYIRNNPAVVKSKLKDLGVEVPGAPENDLAAPIAADPIMPAPPEKIILSDADPVTPAVPASIVSTGSPRLAGPTGSFDIPEGESLISREAGAGSLVIADPSISRRHATLIRNGGSVAVRDEGSTNGTFVNGQKISSETALRAGDEVQFGAVRFRFEG